MVQSLVPETKPSADPIARRKNEIFVSYCRRDKVFVQKLVESFRRCDRDPWVDWEDIKPTEDWWKAIQSGIEAADTFVFIISPDSIASTVCRQEVEYAVAYNKRLVPIVWREGFEMSAVHPSLGSHNWLFFRETDDYDTAFKTLIESIDTDLDHVRMHTRLLLRAIEWEAKGQDESYLLRGSDLTEAETWLNRSDKKTPEPTASQKDYISDSRQLETARQEAEIQRQRAEIKRQRILSGAGLVVSFLAVVSALGAFRLYKFAEASSLAAQKSEIRSSVATAEALFDAHNELDAMVASLKVARDVQKLPPALQDETWGTALIALRQNVYGVREFNRLQGHNESVEAVNFSPNGQQLVTASSDGTAGVWSVDGRLMNRLIGHQGSVSDAVFSPDNQTIVTASTDKTLRLWKPDGSMLKVLQGHTARIHQVSFSPDGKNILSASEDGTVRLWGHTQILRTFDLGSPVFSARFSPDGKTIAAGSSNGTLTLLAVDGSSRKTVPVSDGEVNVVVFSPSSKLIATGSTDGSIRIWNRDGTLIRKIGAHQARISALVFSPEGSTIASGSADNSIKLWDLKGRLLDTFEAHSDSISDLSFSPNGAVLASASRDRTARLWRIKSDLVTTLRGHEDTPYSVTFSPDSQLIVSGSNDGQMIFWKPDGTLLRSVQGHSDRVNSLNFKVDGQSILSTSDDGMVNVWSREGQKLKTYPRRGSVSSRAASLAPNDTLFATGMDDATILLWGPGGQFVRSLQGHSSRVWTVRFSPDGQTLASGSDAGRLIFWKPDGTMLKRLDAHTQGIREVAFSPDGQTVASASQDGTIGLWKPDGTAITKLKGHNSEINSVRFSPDGQVIAAGSEDGTIMLWRTDGTQLRTLKRFSASIESVTFSPDGNVLASASADNTITLWRLDRTTLSRSDSDLLLTHTCQWLRNYLQTNPNMGAQRSLCPG